MAEEIVTEYSVLTDDFITFKSCSASPGVCDFGVQWCFEPTDVCKAPPSEIACKKSGIGISSPVKTETKSPQHPNNAEWKVSHDLNYVMNAPPKVIFPTYDDGSFKTIPLPPVHNITCDQDESTDAVDIGHEGYANDEIEMIKIWTPAGNYLMHISFYLMITLKWNHLDINFKSPLLIWKKKFLVFGSCLNELLKRCPECGDAIIHQKNKTSGTMLLVEVTCHSGHIKTWESPPVEKRKPL